MDLHEDCNRYGPDFDGDANRPSEAAHSASSRLEPTALQRSKIAFLAEKEGAEVLGIKVAVAVPGMGVCEIDHMGRAVWISG